MKRIGVLTSGGDAPGMNACIRSVVRTAIYKDVEIFGITRGYQGMIEGECIPMNARSVSNILSKGGTILKTSRSKEFMTKEGRKKAKRMLDKNRIEGLVVIGGNGSFKGAQVFGKEFGVKNIGAPGTIDNDISGSDYTIGAHTAVNTALDAIDKIRDTVTSMERIYIVEVMGRDEPFIAIRVGLAGGSEDVLFPFTEFDIDKMCLDIEKGRKRGKISWIIVVSEGVAKAQDVANIIGKKTKFDVRAVTLGHVQRGGSPDAYDRILASRMGSYAVEALLEGHTGEMVGIVSDKKQLVPYAEACKHDPNKIKLDEELYKLTKLLTI
jgi:6-phosphofructokinase 1